MLNACCFEGSYHDKLVFMFYSQTNKKQTKKILKKQKRNKREKKEEDYIQKNKKAVKLEGYLLESVGTSVQCSCSNDPREVEHRPG